MMDAERAAGLELCECGHVRARHVGCIEHDECCDDCSRCDAFRGTGVAAESSP